LWIEGLIIADETKEILTISPAVKNDYSLVSYSREEKDYSRPEFIKFIKKVFDAFQLIESQTMSLTDVFLKHYDNRKDILQSLFISCNFWGFFDI
jgi:hypothetical protein